MRDGGISVEEMGKVLRKVKRGKSFGLEGGWGGSVIKWLANLFNLCWVLGKVPQDWQDLYMVSSYKGKCEICV